MANIQLLKRRIKAAQNVSKATRAMQMIAASKMKRAQEATLATRPYVEKLIMLTQNIANRVEDKTIHPYLMQNDSKKSLLIVLASDKGLCGGLITNLLREFLQYTKTEKDSSYIVVGKKVERQVTHLTNEVIASFQFGVSLPKYEMIFPIIKLIDEYYLSGKVGSVKILFTKFTSVFSQTPQVKTILPIELPTDESLSDTYLIEPDAQSLLPGLLKQYLEMNVYQGLLESFVSYQAAQMVAMQNATDNAGDIIDTLKLEYNKTRQSNITSELLDISSSRTQ